MHGVWHPDTVKPQLLQKSLQRTVANTPGAQLVPQESSQRALLHRFTLSNPVAPGTHGQHAFVPEEIVMVTVPPAHKLQSCVEPTGSVGGTHGPIPITVRGVATIEPRMTGGA